MFSTDFSVGEHEPSEPSETRTSFTIRLFKIDSKLATPYHLAGGNPLLSPSCVLDTFCVVVNYCRLPHDDKVVSKEGFSG